MIPLGTEMNYNHSETRVWPEKCMKDKDDGLAEDEYDTKYREQLYVY